MTAKSFFSPAPGIRRNYLPGCSQLQPKHSINRKVCVLHIGQELYYLRQIDKVMASQNVDVHVCEECIRGSFKVSINLIFSFGKNICGQCS